MILGFEFFDCVQAVGGSLVLFGISGSHLLALVVGFMIVLLKSAYRKLYPKNTLYFWKNKKDGVAIKHLLSNSELS